MVLFEEPEKQVECRARRPKRKPMSLQLELQLLTKVKLPLLYLPLLAAGITVRTGLGQWIGEGVATFGLLVTIQTSARFRAALFSRVVTAS